jgi:hypothetical protein
MGLEGLRKTARHFSGGMNPRAHEYQPKRVPKGSVFYAPWPSQCLASGYASRVSVKQLTVTGGSVFGNFENRV